MDWINKISKYESTNQYNELVQLIHKIEARNISTEKKLHIINREIDEFIFENENDISY
jgi:hypothetical protein